MSWILSPDLLESAATGKPVSALAPRPRGDYAGIMHIIILSQTLQASIGPFVLISGTGLLLLSQTNRYGRPIDRIRQLCAEYPSASEAERFFIRAQIRNLHQRCRILRAAMALAIASICLAALVVFLLFTGLTVNAPVSEVAAVLFAASMLSLILSMILYFRDIALRLISVRIKMRRTIPDWDREEGEEPKD